MFSECLRAELASKRIGVSAICPGLIATNITNATTYVGRSEQDQERVRARASKLYARRNYTPDRVAEQIVATVKRNRAVRPVSPEAWLMYAMSRLAPSALRLAARANTI
jgi:short-subunit dehydrogenase